VDEITGGGAFFAFELNFQEFQRAVLAAACQQTIRCDAQFGLSDGVDGRARFDDLEILAAEFCVGSGPGLKSTHAVDDRGGAPGKIHETVFFLQDGCETGLRVVLRARVKGL
jgi:hypothetical protein